MRVLQLLNWTMDGLRWAQVLEYGLGKHNYQITNDTYQSFGKVSTSSFYILFQSNDSFNLMHE